MKGIFKQSQAGRVQLVNTYGSYVYNIILNNHTTVACASIRDADKLFALLNNTAYDVLPTRADAYPQLRYNEVFHSNGLPL